MRFRVRASGLAATIRTTIEIMALYNCAKCPGYCCSYPVIPLTKRDVERLARHHDLSYEEAKAKFTKEAHGHKYTMRRKKDEIYGASAASSTRPPAAARSITRGPPRAAAIRAKAAADTTTSSCTNAAARKTTNSSPSPTTTKTDPGPRFQSSEVGGVRTAITSVTRSSYGSARATRTRPCNP